MNIISSNCISGRIHEVLKLKYDNPFMWVSIQLSDFCKLIENYDILKINNINVCYKVFQLKQRITIILDNLINIYFTHHYQDNTYNTPTKFSYGDIRYYDMLNYVKNKWLNRCCRISGQPIFIYDDIKSYTNCDIMKFINIKTPYKRLLITEHKELKQYETSAFKVYIKPENNYHTLTLTKELLNNKEIYKFLEL